MMLTRKGRSVLKKPIEMFPELYRAFDFKFNKAWFDFYDNEEIGNVGFGYVIYLLSRYGDKMRSGEFYAEKYFKAFPMLATLSARFHRPNEKCFEIRVFRRGLSLLGLVDSLATKSEGYGMDYVYKRSEAFEKVFDVEL